LVLYCNSFINQDGHMTSLTGNTDLRYIGAYLAVTFLVILTTISYVRNDQWRDEVRIWQDAAQKSTNKARPNYYLGIAYDIHHETEKAFRYFARAQEIDPDIVTDWLASSPAPIRRGARSAPPDAAGSLLDDEHRLMLASAYIDEGSYGGSHTVGRHFEGRSCGH
jgi:tetratricopeptide (TPR) repeat protein